MNSGIKDKHTYFFVDESGDPTFYNKYGKNIVGQEGCSKVLILGFIRTNNPEPLRKSVINLMRNIENDLYLIDIPSITKTITKGFHAKNDAPEVREKFFKLIVNLDFKAEFFVARKLEDIFKNKYKRKEQLFYDDLVTKLFENKLHKTENNHIYFAVRGNRERQKPLEDALNQAKAIFDRKWKKNIKTDFKVQPQSPIGEPCLQITDYMNWAIYRAFTKNEARYINFVREKISYLVDIYDLKKYPKNFYSKSNTFSIKKISPL